MPNTPPRVVIIGTGMIGAVHRRAARDAGADVIGVLGSSAKRSAEYAEQWGLERAYASMDEVIADKPDAVQICTPNASHFAYALAAVQAGINVVCEKPLATTAAEAEQLVAAASDAGVINTIPFVYRYHPLVRELRARRINGDFGDVTLVHGSYLQDWLLSPQSSSWRVDAASGGASRAFADIGSHWCDLAEFISGERFSSVSAVTSIAYAERPVPSGPSFGGGATSTDGGSAEAAPVEMMTVTTEDAAIATFRTSSGVVGNTVISQISGGRKNRLWVEVDGSKGSAVFDQENPDSVWLGTEDGATILHRNAGAISADQARLNLVPSGHPQGYPDAFAAFLADTYAAVRDPGNVPDGLPTFADGLRAAHIIDAVLGSAASGAWTDIPA